ncbi:1940_t:CDS:2, partial [Ambispora gerdemannii]
MSASYMADTDMLGYCPMSASAMCPEHVIVIGQCPCDIQRTQTYWGTLSNFHLIRRMTPYPHPQNLRPTKLTVSCGWAFHWVNKPEAKELFDFLNPYLKLPDCQALSGQILEIAVSEGDKAMHEALREDPISITLTFDGWTNVKNKQLLGVMIITSEGKSYVWKATDISIERESHLEVSAVVTDSASPYAAS